jgi:hypothetical protein
MGRRACSSLGTATQCTRRNDIYTQATATDDDDGRPGTQDGEAVRTRLRGQIEELLGAMTAGSGGAAAANASGSEQPLLAWQRLEDTCPVQTRPQLRSLRLQHDEVSRALQELS